MITILVLVVGYFIGYVMDDCDAPPPMIFLMGVVTGTIATAFVE